jgi:hypothetical protein
VATSDLREFANHESQAVAWIERSEQARFGLLEDACGRLIDWEGFATTVVQLALGYQGGGKSPEERLLEVEAQARHALRTIGIYYSEPVPIEHRVYRTSGPDDGLDDGVGEHCGCCAHRRGVGVDPCGGPNCPCAPHRQVDTQP